MIVLELFRTITIEESCVFYILLYQTHGSFYCLFGISCEDQIWQLCIAANGTIHSDDIVMEKCGLSSVFACLVE